MNRNFVLAASILAGTTIGAGIFSLPYVVNQIGLLSGLFYLLFFALVYFAVYIMYASVLRTREGRHDFSYFADLYLSKNVSRFASFAILAETVFVLTIYLILAPTFISLVAEISQFVAVLVFWLLGSVFIFASLTSQGLMEFLGLLAIIFVVLIVFFLGGGSLNAPLFKSMSVSSFFLPFGPLLFSYAARVAVSRMVDEERAAKSAGRPFSFKWAVFAGTFVPALVYFLFVLGILGLTPEVTPEALDGLKNLSAPLLAIFGFLGLITIWTSYFVIGANFREILVEDKSVRPWIASLLVLFLPLLLYLTGFREFLPTLSFTGGLFLGLEGVFLITFWRRAFPNHPRKWISLPLYAVFLTALIYEVVNLVL